MKLFGYVRVSTVEQANEGHSLTAQREQLEGYARLYGHEIVEVFADEGLSAKTLDRPGLRELLDRLDRGEADGVLVAKLDRLTRSVRDLDELLRRYFARARGASRELVSVTEQVDTSTAIGRLVLNLLSCVSQWEREAIAERTQVALTSMKKRGLRTGSVPWGYRLDEDGASLVLDPEEQAAIKLAARLRSQGASLRAIGEQLAGRGYTNRRGRPVFNPPTVKALLSAAESDEEPEA